MFPLLFAALFFTSFAPVLAQTPPELYPYQLKRRGIPFVQSYGPRTYGGHSQCWGIAQASDGTMYFGNGYGVLEYTGHQWSLIELPSRGLVRSMDMGPGDTLYTGGINDVGYIARDQSGQSVFYSLKDQLPEAERGFAQVRFTKVVNGKVFFLDYHSLMIWDIRQKSFTVMKPEFSFGSLMEAEGDLFVGDVSDDIHRYNFDAGELERLPGTKEIALETPKSMVKQGDGYLIAADKAVYFYQPANGTLLPFALQPSPKNFHVSALLRLPDGSLAVRSVDFGFYIYNSDGQLELYLNEANGLANNHLHDALIDNEGALWVTHNMGINRINLHMPFRMFDKRMGLLDIVNDVLRSGSRIFISTHSGTFTFDENQAGFTFVPVLNPNLESFALEKIGKWVLVSASQGLYAVDPVTLKSKLIHNDMAYKFAQSAYDPSVIVFGAQDAVTIIRYDGKDGFEVQGEVQKAPHQIRFMEQDELGVFWIGTTDNKLLLLDLFHQGTLQAPAVTIYDQSHGLPVSQVSPRLVNGTMYLNTQDGIFELQGDSIVRSAAFEEVNTMVPYMEYDEEGNVYLLAGYPPSMKIRKFIPEGDDYVEANSPELSFVESNGLWISTPDFDGSYWISTTDGVLHYTPEGYTPSEQQLSTQISSVSLGDSTIAQNLPFTPVLEAGLRLPAFNYGNQSIRFEFSLPSFNSEDKTQFRYRLEGFDSEWSAWGTTNFKEYSGLLEGRYTFRVESKNLLGAVGKEASYAFSITPPWYRSLWFLFIAGLSFVGGGAYAVRYYSTKRLKRRVEELELQQKIQKERERISSDLHDHVGAQLTSIIAGLQITEQIEDFQFNPKVRDIIDSLKEDASQTMTNLRDSIWSLHSEEVTVGSFCEHLEAYMRSRLKYYPQVSFHAELQADTNKALSPISALNLLRVMQEAFQNILKHAKATHITLNARSTSQRLELILADDGVGFDKGMRGGEHYGLDNMKRRMEEADGELKIVTASAQGTAITARVAFTPN